MHVNLRRNLRWMQKQKILAKLAAYPEIVIRAANSYEPHQVGNYLKELAALFHGWYNEHKVLNNDAELTQARLLLSVNVQQVLRNGLELLRCICS